MNPVVFLVFAKLFGPWHSYKKDYLHELCDGCQGAYGRSEQMVICLNRKYSTLLLCRTNWIPGENRHSEVGQSKLRSVLDGFKLENRNWNRSKTE